MKLEQLIAELQQQLALVGNVDLYTEVNDGRSTSAYSLRTPVIKYREIWKGHPAGKKWFLSIH
jgi:hypothetical protein